MPAARVLGEAAERDAAALDGGAEPIVRLYRPRQAFRAVEIGPAWLRLHQPPVIAATPRWSRCVSLAVLPSYAAALPDGAGFGAGQP